MGKEVDAKQRVVFEELLRGCLYEQEGLRRVPVRKGVIKNKEVVGGKGGVVETRRGLGR